ncbi:MAG: Wzz/FepE/Etk N-terminal domain-containing protein, partial [Deltaproteobacteria bacterium]
MTKDTAKTKAPAPSSSPQDSIDWREYFHAVVDRLWIVILCVIVAGIYAGYSLSKVETSYRARAVLFIEQEQAKVLNPQMQQVRDEAIRSIDMINTVVDLLRSYPFAQRVGMRLKLDQDPRFLSAAGIPARDASPERVAGALSSMVSAVFRTNTRLIDLMVTTLDPNLSVKLANAYADEYIRYVFERRSDAAKSATQFLLEEADRLRKKMRVSEEAMQSFRERERAASLETMLTQAQFRVSTLITDSLAAEKRLKELDDDLKIVEEKSSDADLLLQLPSIANHPAIASLNAAIETQKDELDFLNQRYLPDHPLFATATNRLQVLIESRKDALTSTILKLQATRDELRAQLVTLTASRAEAEKNLLDITGKSVEYNAISRELQTGKALYDAVVNRLNEVDLTKGLSEESIRIHEPALGAAPIPVPYIKFFVLGILGGLVLGVFFLFSLKVARQWERAVVL